MKRRTLYASIGLCGLLILSAAIPPTAASSPWPDDLFGPPGSDVSAQVQLPPQAKGRRNRQATVKRDLLQADEITLNLFDDVMLVAIRDRLVDDVKGSTVWIGHIEEEGDSEVILAVRGKAMMGTVRIGEQMYEIVYKGGETHVIQQIDPNVTVEDADPLYAPDPGPQAAPVDNQSSAPAPEAAADTAGTVVDLMVVYTPKARANASVWMVSRPRSSTRWRQQTRPICAAASRCSSTWCTWRRCPIRRAGPTCRPPSTTCREPPTARWTRCMHANPSTGRTKWP